MQAHTDTCENTQACIGTPGNTNGHAHGHTHTDTRTHMLTAKHGHKPTTTCTHRHTHRGAHTNTLPVSRCDHLHTPSLSGVGWHGAAMPGSPCTQHPLNASSRPFQQETGMLSPKRGSQTENGERPWGSLPHRTLQDTPSSHATFTAVPLRQNPEGTLRRPPGPVRSEHPARSLAAPRSPEGIWFYFPTFTL